MQDYLDKIPTAKHLPKARVARNSGLNRIYVYQILSGKRIPSRDKLIALAFGMTVSFSKTQHLKKNLVIGELYVKDKWDAIILFALMNDMASYGNQ